MNRRTFLRLAAAGTALAACPIPIAPAPPKGWLVLQNWGAQRVLFSPADSYGTKLDLVDQSSIPDSWREAIARMHRLANAHKGMASVCTPV